MKKLFLLAGLLLIVLTGCRSGREAPEQQQAELKKQNELIRAELRELTGRIDALEKKSVSSLQPPFIHVGRGRAKLLKVKPLPPGPTDAQILAYLREIADCSREQVGFSVRDPQVDLCRKIGPGHLKLLLSFFRNRERGRQYSAMRFYLSAALPDLVTAKDIPLIKANIVAVPELQSVVTSAEFARPMKDEIFETLGKSPPYFPAQFDSKFQRTVAGLVETPEDLKTLEEIYINDHRRSFMLPILLKIPKCDVAAVTVRAWRRASREKAGPNLLGYTYNVLHPRALEAFRYGHDVGACKFLLESLIMGSPFETNDFRSRSLVKEFKRLSDFPVQDRARLAEWYAENREKIVFDKKSGKFTLQK